MANSAINSLKYGDNTYIFTIPYGSCSTAAGTAAKAVTVDNFSLETGAKVAVKFTVTNTAANPTLNVNSTGAKAIYYNGAAITAGYLKANKVYEFIYNGTQWDFVGDIDTDTDTDTKNTAGTTNKVNTKLFLAGATSQASNPTTYSNVNVYIGTDNHLYSGGKKVVTSAEDLGLSGAMRFRGVVSSFPTEAETAEHYSVGDVIVFKNETITKEYVLTATDDWVELGDETNYVPKIRSIIAGEVFDGGGSLNDDITISHISSDDFTAINQDGNRKVIKTITSDKFGHITSLDLEDEDINFVRPADLPNFENFLTKAHESVNGTTGAKGHVKLTSTITSTVEDLATTPKGVYDHVEDEINTHETNFNGTTGAKGHVKLTSTINSTSGETLATTPKGVYNVINAHELNFNGTTSAKGHIQLTSTINSASGETLATTPKGVYNYVTSVVNTHETKDPSATQPSHVMLVETVASGDEKLGISSKKATTPKYVHSLVNSKVSSLAGDSLYIGEEGLGTSTPLNADTLGGSTKEQIIALAKGGGSEDTTTGMVQYVTNTNANSPVKALLTNAANGTHIYPETRSDYIVNASASSGVLQFIVSSTTPSSAYQKIGTVWFHGSGEGSKNSVKIWNGVAWEAINTWQ